MATGAPSQTSTIPYHTGAAIAGFSLNESLPWRGDVHDATMAWVGGRQVATEDTVKLQLELTDARLFSLEWL